MNKNILYIAIALVIGVITGWVLFGDSSTESGSNGPENHEHSGMEDHQLWTCSMHPQIMQPEPGDCPICGMDLIPVESGQDGLAPDEIKLTKNAMALADIQTTIVGATTLGDEQTITLSGKIKMNEEANAVQASYFEGRIEELNINYEGQEVKKGQLLATLYAPELIGAQQELITAASLKETQPELYKAVRNKLKLLKLSENQINRIEASGTVIENFPIYATVTGTVSEKLASEGDFVKKGQPILKVSNLNSVWAEFDVYETQISEFSKGQQLLVLTNAYPAKEFPATISFIDPILNTNTRTVTVRADLKNGESLLKPGMFVTAQVKNKLAGKPDIKDVSIPASAVLWTGERSVVYVKTNPDEPVFIMKEVKLSNTGGTSYTVISGLEPGDEIVTNGTFTIDAAAQLQGKRSMMNTTGNDPTSSRIKITSEMEASFRSLREQYFLIKDALVRSELGQAKAQASTALKLVKENEASAALSSLRSAIEKFSKTNTLEGARENFISISEQIIALSKAMPHSDQPIYIQYCPMANSNQGAFWISKEKEIRNPYYGDAMLTCGEVREVL